MDFGGGNSGGWGPWDYTYYKMVTGEKRGGGSGGGSQPGGCSTAVVVIILLCLLISLLSHCHS